MKRAVFFSLVILGVLSVGALSANAQNRINGFVFDEARRPVSQLYVELLDEGYSSLARTQTNGIGLYNFTGLTAGQYTVRVLVGGTNFIQQSISVSFSNIPGARVGSEQVDFYLRVQKQAGNTTSGAPGVVFAQEVPAAAKNLYEGGVADLQNKREEGLTKIKEAIEMFPSYFVALDRLGNEYLLRGHYQAAFVLFKSAIAVNPKSFSSTFGLGLSEFKLSQPAMAVKSLSTAVELDNSSINGHLWLGIALHGVKKYDQAVTSLKKANSLSEGSAADVHWQLARVYKDQGKFGMAADELELFLKCRPDAQNVSEIRNTITSLRKKS